MTDILPVHYLDYLPIWAVFLLSIIFLFGFSEIGSRIGRRRQSTDMGESSQSEVIMGALLGLLAFMLAFSFGIAEARYEARKQAVLDEANAIGTTWLRSRMLPAPHSSQILPLLKRYVDMRIAGAGSESVEELREALDHSTELHEKLWRHVVTLGRDHSRSITLGLFIDSLNDVIDLHETRVTIAHYRMPTSIWVALYLIAFAAMTMVGLHAGLSGGRSLLVTVLLTATLAMAISFVIDLDRPSQTLFSVSQQSLMDLRETMDHPAR
ncbi:MAG: hypothetical protein WED00_15455 [Aquisalimonadaceae bacterium]